MCPNWVILLCRILIVRDRPIYVTITKDVARFQFKRKQSSDGSIRWGRGGTGPQPNLAQPPKFLDTVVLLLVELIGSIVISLKFRLAVVASQMMRGHPPPKYFS